MFHPVQFDMETGEFLTKVFDLRADTAAAAAHVHKTKAAREERCKREEAFGEKGAARRAGRPCAAAACIGVQRVCVFSG